MKFCSPWVAVALAATPLWAVELSDLGDFDPGDTDVIILGEVHDNALHHAAQADLISQIKPSAIVFEMLTPEQAAITNTAEPTDGVGPLEDALDWSNSGWPDFALYAPVFEATLGIPAFGAALPPSDVRRSVMEGAAALFGPDAAIYELDQPLDPEQQATREAGQGEAHCDALPQEMLPGFVEAQRLRDAHFARVTLEALAEHGGPVVVITGNGHARTDWGMPAALSIAAPDVDVISLGQLEAPPETPPPFDLWRVTAPAEREDPCAVFQ